jgi:hypothetical protein
VEYDFQKLRDGSNAASVALLLSLSGRIESGSIPAALDGRFTVYEITLHGQEPGVEFLRRREDVSAFRKTYRDALSSIVAAHGHVAELHLLPAVPAPIAIACGMEVMPKAHPALVLYDNVKGTFQDAITTNTETDL